MDRTAGGRGFSAHGAPMGPIAERERAMQPEDLGQLFVARANGDLEGLGALYEPDAVLAFPPGQLTVGRTAIRRVYAELLGGSATFAGVQQPVLRHGDLALTSTRISGGATVEIARRQPDGTWLWVIDQPNILG